MPRALLIPVVLVAVPLLRFAAGLLMVLLVLASIGGLIVAAQTGEARDWGFLAGMLLAVGVLRWFRILLTRVQHVAIDPKAY
jgi:hypothetical protein